MAGLLAALGGLAGVYAAGVGSDNSLERWIEPTGQPAIEYRHFRDTFTSDEFVLVALSGRSLFEEAALDVMLAALEALEAIPHVSQVTGIPSGTGIFSAARIWKPSRRNSTRRLSTRTCSFRRMGGMRGFCSKRSRRRARKAAAS